MPYKDPEKAKRNKKEYYEKHRAHILKYQVEYYQRPQTKQMKEEYRRKYMERPEIREKTKQYQKEYRKKYYEKNKELMNKNTRMWYQNNKARGDYQSANFLKYGLEKQ
jgi:hypothetical protein